jgi:hypothetical protein
VDSPKQILARCLGFAAFYGLIVVNWVDLFHHSLPAYSVWLSLIYFAPGMGLLAFTGIRHWRLAIAMGLVASLANDLGFFFVGDLAFGFHEPLGSWFAGQLGFEGMKRVSSFRFPYGKFYVYSWEMGAWVWLRLAAVPMVALSWLASIRAGTPTVRPAPSLLVQRVA